jgi:hypothetical protein
MCRAASLDGIEREQPQSKASAMMVMSFVFMDIRLQTLHTAPPEFVKKLQFWTHSQI